jgi:hypothetical protein
MNIERLKIIIDFLILIIVSKYDYKKLIKNV